MKWFRRHSFNGTYGDVRPKWHIINVNSEDRMLKVALCGYEWNDIPGGLRYRTTNPAVGERCMRCSVKHAAAN